MELCMCIIELILKGKMTFNELPDGIVKENIRVILTTWGLTKYITD